MLKAIQKERLLEFPGEMLRKQDLIRWNLLGTAVRQTVTDMRALRDRTGKYADVPTVVYTRTKLLASWSTMAWLRVRQQLLLAKAGHNSTTTSCLPQ